MCSAEIIGDEEIILRRIPPSNSLGGSPIDSVKALENGRFRATSVRLTVREDETGLSCSRLKQTSPRQLLDALKEQGHDPTGWAVCRLSVAEIRKLGLQVVHIPTAEDPGHCEIRGKDGILQFPNAVATKLSKKSLILTEEEVANTIAGGALP